MQFENGTKNETGVYNAGNTSQYPSTAPPPYPGPPLSAHTYPHVDSRPTVVHGTTVVHHGPTLIPTVVPAVVVGHQMGPKSTTYVCKSCNHQIVTRVERSASMRTHLIALFLCFVGCWPFACLPYCVDSCNNADHYCSNCGAYVGSYIG
ncbi:lipopolysaccharide-induced tumor necrosis factor-alpha factor homolog [Battus philenor]|uniref:lipopolysaccharide-induced tumor necrosis factor-alpha factor homolog n=1 Tax=Battus philenor TaxID=42288 RepID=UPI0035CE88BE